jgi:hypothetical protein
MVGVHHIKDAHEKGEAISEVYEHVCFAESVDSADIDQVRLDLDGGHAGLVLAFLCCSLEALCLLFPFL